MDLGGEILPVTPDIWIKYNENTEVYYVSKKKQSFNLIQNVVKYSNPDIIFINGIYSWYFNLVPLLFCKVSRKVVSARGMLHPGALTQKKIKKYIYLTLWKILRLNRCCDFHATNREEKKYIQNTFGKKANVFIAQNFPTILLMQQGLQKKEGTLKLVSIALISEMKNHLLVLKALMNCDCSINYSIYGPIKDQTYWNSCIEQIKQLPKNMTVNYHGDIPPHQIEQALALSHVFILPSKSENFGHAIYEALSCGKPVITSMATPWNNLRSSKAGINVTPENPMELSAAIKYFAAMGNDEFTQWTYGANKYAEEAINIEDIKEQYRKMFLSNTLSS